MKILLYNSSSINQESANHIHENLARSESPITEIHDPQELESFLDEREVLLVIPGGKTGKVSEELALLAQRIKDRVENGWNYIGICCGANLSSERLVFQRGPIRFTLPDRDMPLFSLLPIEAEGPALPSSHNTARIRSREGSFLSRWIEGSSFRPIHQVETLATYEGNQKPAAIFGEVCNGAAVIFGFHPELPLEEDQENRRAFFERAISPLNIL